MSTEIRSSTARAHPIVITTPATTLGYAEVQINGKYYRTSEVVAAVEAECGVRLVPADSIVIDRADLPEVERLPSGSVRVGSKTFTPTDAADHYSWAVELLALAEDLAAHPPVDEVQVEAAYDVIQGALHRAGITMADVDHGPRMDIARTFVAQGWTKGGPS